jgi:PAS domain S-box-containing protein
MTYATEEIQVLSQQKEDLLRLVIDTIPTMAWSVRPDGVVDFVNQRWLDYTGLSLEQFLGDPMGPVQPEDIPRVLEKWRAAMAVGEPYEDEMRLRGADREYRWFLVRTVPLRDRHGNIVKWYGTSTDIEDRKRAEDALRESEEKFRQLAENIGEVFWMTTPAMDEVLYVSPAYESVWGRSLESVRQRPQSFMDAIHSEDRERVVAIVEGQRQRKSEVEYRIVRPDGSVRWIRDRGFPVKDASGKVYRIAGVAEDITERKRVEMALQKNEQLLSETQVLGHTGSWEHNLVTGEIANTEGNLRLFFGDDHSKGARFEDFAEVVHPDDREYVSARHAQLLAEGGPPDIEYRVVWPDGTVHVLFGRATVVRDAAGRSLRVYGTNVDITERKRAENALRDSGVQLQALSRRLVELQESERKKLARELHDRVGQSLTALKINIDILQPALASQGNAEVLARVADSAELLESTMNTIVNVLSELRPPMLDDHGLAAALDWHARNFSRRTGIAVTVRAGEPDLRPAPQIEIAFFRIAQEALNNVAKHARAQNVEIALDHANGEYMMSVQDDGIGFDGVEETSAMPKPGLGMVTMRERAQAVGGRFEVQAQPCPGTRITVRVPR